MEIIDYKIDKLKTLMDENAIRELKNQINKYVSLDNNNDNDNYKKIDNLFLYPKIRQYGLKVEIKQRKMLVMMIKKDNKELYYRFSFNIKNLLLNYIENKIKEKEPGFSIDNNLEKTLKLLKQKGILTEINHYSIWINNNIYHWGSDIKKWNIYGENETNREVVNDWEPDLEYPNTYFTLRTISEIEAFCNKYQKTQFDINYNNSHHFRTSMIKFLGIENSN